MKLTLGINTQIEKKKFNLISEVEFVCNGQPARSGVRHVHTEEEFKNVYDQYKYVEASLETHEDYLEFNARRKVYIKLDFLIIHFEFTKDNFHLLYDAEQKQLFFCKLIFAQPALKIPFKDHDQVFIRNSVILSDEFGLTGTLPRAYTMEHPKIGLLISNSVFNVARFGCSEFVAIENSRFDKLTVAFSKLKSFWFRHNLIKEKGSFYTQFSQDIDIELHRSELGYSSFYFSASTERLLLQHCNVETGVKISSSGKVNSVVFDKCDFMPTASMDLELCTIQKEFKIDLLQLPAAIVFPESTSLADEVITIPATAKLKPSMFIPPLLDEDALKMFEINRTVADKIYSPESYKRKVQFERIDRNLERAYQLVSLAGRQSEALDVLYRIQVEARKRRLFCRHLEIELLKPNMLMRGYKWGAAFFEFENIASFLAEVLMGHFIRIRVLLRTLGLLIAFTTMFFFLNSEYLLWNEKTILEHVSSGKLDLWGKFLSSLYFSAVTVTTLGYGDLQPVEGGRVAAVIAALLGLFLSGFVVAAILRRYSR